jgi:hypothetical protein
VAEALAIAANGLKPLVDAKPTHLLGRRLGLQQARLLVEIDGGTIEFEHAHAEVRLRLPLSLTALPMSSGNRCPTPRMLASNSTPSAK